MNAYSQQTLVRGAVALAVRNVRARKVDDEYDRYGMLRLRGGNDDLWWATDPEILAEGPAGTGKTRTILERINDLCHTHAGLRVLIVRRHQVTLTTTALVTFDNKVLTPRDNVVFFGGSKHETAGYRYPNGSRIVTGGMDNADKILSSEYDLVYCNEATELTVEAWETLISRLRNGILPAARIIGDCNPAHSTHWLLQRALSGKTRHIKSRLQDNPAYYDDGGQPTPEGQAYIDRLQQLSGSRYQRLVLGEWVGYEDAVYPHFDRSIHVSEMEEGIRFVDGAFGADFGRVHKSAAVAVSRDSLGRLWVREAWGRPSTDHGAELQRSVAGLRSRYGLRRGRVDPNQDVLAGLIGASIARSGEGSRQHRIDLTARLLNTFPGGIVPDLKGETRGRAMSYGPNAADDTPGLLFVKGAPGIDELCDELEAYHYEHRLTDTKDEMVVARINDDLVAAMEYAIEELEEYTAQPLPTTATLVRATGRPREVIRRL